MRTVQIENLNCILLLLFLNVQNIHYDNIKLFFCIAGFIQLLDSCTARFDQTYYVELLIMFKKYIQVLFSLTLQNTSFLKVPFPSEREATIALQSLSPDPEPRKGGITKNLDVSGQTLSV